MVTVNLFFFTDLLHNNHDVTIQNAFLNAIAQPNGPVDKAREYLVKSGILNEVNPFLKERSISKHTINYRT